MATEDKETKQAPAFTFNEAVVKQKLAEIEKGVNNQQGKKGCNPFLWLNSTVNPLIKRYMEGERTKELQEAIVALPSTPPVLYAEAPKEEAPAEKAPQLIAKGLNLKPSK